MERTVTTMPRGGARTPGAGKALGRPRLHPEGERERIAKTISASLNPDEYERLKALLAELKINQSDFLRRCLKHAWLFRLTDAQLDALRSLAEGGRG